MAIVELKNVEVSYGATKALRGVTCTVEGGAVGLLGPNGAGKSTTILMLVGLIQPTSGACYIGGIEVAAHPIEVKKKIGYMPEDVGFYADRTAKENLDYAARFYGLSERERKQRVDDLLGLVGLDGVGTTVGGYSKGMRQRLGLARALINDPAVVVLDEPTANLDPEGVREYRDLVTRLAGEGKTVFVSSHILSEVRAVCRTVGLLAAGRLVAQGTIDEVARTLASPGGETFRIVVETAEDLPDLSDPDIIEFERDGNRAVIQAKSDIRERLAAAIAEEGLHIREIRLEEPDIEDAFMALYRG